MPESWAISEEVGAEAEAALEVEMSEAVEAELAEGRHLEDEQAGFSEAESDLLESEPSQIDRRPASEKYTPDPETPEAARANQGRAGVDMGTDKDFQYFEVAGAQVAEGFEEKVDDALMEAGAEFDVSELKTATAQAEQLFQIENPDYLEKISGATYMASRRLADQYQAQGHGKGAAYKAAVAEVQNFIWTAAAQAVAQGRNPAEVLYGVANQELASHGKAGAATKGGQRVADIQAGMRSAKTLGKAGFAQGGGSAKGETSDAREARLSSMYEDDPKSFHKEYNREPDWLPR